MTPEPIAHPPTADTPSAAAPPVATAPASDTTPKRPECQIDREIRFAVVMYGGVSLAIYMNGISQELFHLVRSTAVDPNDDTRFHIAAPTGTERVYREVARLLNRAETEVPIRTRFIVDILTGTSAGGINAVFLAKALANDQSLDPIAKMWVAEGGLERLINDSGSTDDINLKTQRPPQALLNGQRMYLKLVGAFDEMDRLRKLSNEQRLASPYLTDGLDLFVTATDINGLPLRLRLWDEVANERRHKQVFRIRYRRGETNEFCDTNSFLAFACRATSSFPFAFEPMTLSSIEPLLAGITRGGTSAAEATSAHWAPFFEAYRRGADEGMATPDAPSEHYKDVAFGDGGYLDNKPFGYAIDVLSERQSALPGDRKLIYIDPDPERSKPVARDVPNALDNSIEALIGLPGYETIREELHRVLARNRLVRRVRRVLEPVDVGILARPTHSDLLTSAEWLQSSLEKLVQRYGPAYGGYHALRIATATDELSMVVSRAIGIDLQSDEAAALRMLTRQWRKQKYRRDIAPFENPFLDTYDIGWSDRRLRFVRSQIDALLSGEWTTVESTLKRLELQIQKEELPAFRIRLAEHRRTVTDAIANIAAERRLMFRADPKVNGVAEVLMKKEAAGGPTPADLLTGEILPSILKKETEAEREQEALRLATSYQEPLDRLAAKIGESMGRVSAQAATFRENLKKHWEVCKQLTDPSSVADRVVYHYHRYFEQYDVIAFPLLHATGVGELVSVDVIRIAPARWGNLAGERFLHFGACLEERWRVNDLLWGRLDGARRLIDSLLHDVVGQDVRDRLIRDAHTAIMREYLAEMNVAAIPGHLSRAVERSAGRLFSSDRRLMAGRTNAEVRRQVQQMLEASSSPERLAEYYANSFTLDAVLDPGPALKALGRSTRVIGQLLEGIANRRERSATPGAWIARLGRVFWGLVEVAVPGSIWHKVMRHWTAILAVCGALLILIGTLFDLDKAPQVGWITLAAVLGTRTLASILGSLINARYWRFRAVITLVALSIASLAVLGTFTAVQLVEENTPGAYHVTAGAVRGVAIDLAQTPVTTGVVALVIALAVVGVLTTARWIRKQVRLRSWW